MKLDDLEKFRNQPYEEYVTDLQYVKQRLDGVMEVWQERQSKEELQQVITNALEKYPEDCILTKEILKDVEDNIMKYLERKITESL